MANLLSDLLHADTQAVAAIEHAARRTLPVVATPTGEATIAILDDEPINIKLIRKYLTTAGYTNFLTSSDPVVGLEMLATTSPDVLLLDVMMPVIGGLEVLQRLRAQPAGRSLPVIVVTATDDESTKVQALELGATDFLAKPVKSVELVPRVRNALTLKGHLDRLRSAATTLEKQVRQRTAELAASRLELIHCLARAAEYRDNETGRHVVRIGRYAGTLAKRMGLEPGICELIEHAAPLHDMGKIGIPDTMLLKPDKLTPEEFDIMRRHAAFGKTAFDQMTVDEAEVYRRHTEMGGAIMDVGQSPVLAMAGRIALTHHERWDGQGYPRGLRGDEIPLEGRITAVCDTFDAVSSRRPYKPPLPLDKCFRLIDEERGRQFDPAVVDAFLASKNEIVRIRIEFADVV